MRTLDAKLVVDLREALEGWSDPIAFGVGLDGAVYAAAHRSHEPLVVHESGASFPKSRFDAPTDYLVLRWKAGDLRQVVARETIAVSYVQPYAKGVLLTGARCVLTEDGPETNAAAIDWSGRELARFTLGDGIADVRVAGDTIWVSYFDEGVFGNYGWKEPLGAAGLVAFGLRGEKLWSYDPRTAGTDMISDAYALNVAGESDAWVYFYTEFPIVRIHEGEYRHWSLGEGGARALAVRSNRVLLAGDYRDASRGRIVELEEGARVTENVVLRDPQGAPLGDVVMRGVADRLYVFANRQVGVIGRW
jgi:hypothetical protein